MSEHTVQSKVDKRPEFMAMLGLSPPYSAEDVKQAYFQRAKSMHPDHGGATADFQQLQQAFEQAQEYVAFRGDRRGWIASKMESYIEVQEAIDRLEAIGAVVHSDTRDWLHKSIGDFAQLTESVERVRLENSPNGDALLKALVELRPALKGLAAVELPGCQVRDASVLMLEAYQELRRLDLSRTPVSSACLRIVDLIPTLEVIQLKSSKVGWWARRSTERKLRQRRKALLAG